MSHFRMGAVHPAKELAVEDDAAAYAGAEGDIDEVAASLARTPVSFGKSSGVGGVLYRDRSFEFVAEFFDRVSALPPGQRAEHLGPDLGRDDLGGHDNCARLIGDRADDGSAGLGQNGEREKAKRQDHRWSMVFALLWWMIDCRETGHEFIVNGNRYGYVKNWTAFRGVQPNTGRQDNELDGLAQANLVREEDGSDLLGKKTCDETHSLGQERRLQAPG